MILTVTMNPSVDISYPLDKFILDKVNRCKNASKTPGGKGLNVARVIKQLGGEVAATGIVGGATGNFIKRELGAAGIKNDFLHIEKESRNCIAILHEGKQTEILEPGPQISQDEAQAFLNKFESLLNGVKLVTISGSLPKGLGDDYYAGLIAAAAKKNIPVLLDTSGGALAGAVNSRPGPFLIKPNRDEIAWLENKKTDDIKELAAILKTKRYGGIEWIVVSLGAEGALAKHNNKFYLAQVPEIKAVNPVGSGDAATAGLAFAIASGKGDEEILKTAMTAGLLNAMEQKTGHINPDNFETYYKQIKATEITGE
jgi:tagatose 6-phosphate kinase